MCIFGLISVNPEEVKECFTDHCIEDNPEYSKITEFCDYLLDNKISFVKLLNNIFPPKMWVQKSSDKI